MYILIFKNLYTILKNMYIWFEEYGIRYVYVIHTIWRIRRVNGDEWQWTDIGGQTDWMDETGQTESDVEIGQTKSDRRNRMLDGSWWTEFLRWRHYKMIRIRKLYNDGVQKRRYVFFFWDGR
jgi:hypothetical protein